MPKSRVLLKNLTFPEKMSIPKSRVLLKNLRFHKIMTSSEKMSMPKSRVLLNNLRFDKILTFMEQNQGPPSKFGTTSNFFYVFWEWGSKRGQMRQKNVRNKVVPDRNRSRIEHLTHSLREIAQKNIAHLSREVIRHSVIYYFFTFLGWGGGWGGLLFPNTTQIIET